MTRSQGMILITIVTISLSATRLIQAEPPGPTAGSVAQDGQGTQSGLGLDALPPIPLSTAREKVILQAVFSRFPGSDPNRIMDFLRVHFPHKIRAFTLMSMREADPAVEYLTEVVRDCTELIRTQERDPERFENLLKTEKLENLAYEQADSMRRSAGADRDAQKRALMATLEEAFQLKQALMGQELANLETELKALGELIKKREESKDVLLKRRFSQITGDSDLAEW